MRQDKTKPIFGLDKIPDSELLKASQVEIGMLKSYIDELTYERHNLKKELFELRKLNPDEYQVARKEYMQTKLGKLLNAQITDLRREVKTLKQQYKILLNRYLVLKGE